MNLPIVGRLDMKSLVIGLLLAYFVVPWAMSLMNRPRTSKNAA